MNTPTATTVMMPAKGQCKDDSSDGSEEHVDYTNAGVEEDGEGDEEEEEDVEVQIFRRLRKEWNNLAATVGLIDGEKKVELRKGSDSDCKSTEGGRATYLDMSSRWRNGTRDWAYAKEKDALLNSSHLQALWAAQVPLRRSLEAAAISPPPTTTATAAVTTTTSPTTTGTTKTLFDLPVHVCLEIFSYLALHEVLALKATASGIKILLDNLAYVDPSIHIQVHRGRLI